MKPDITDPDDLRSLLKIDWLQAKGRTIEEMRDNFINNPKGKELYQRGDCILVWVNEGDICMQDYNIWIYNENLNKGALFDKNNGI